MESKTDEQRKTRGAYLTFDDYLNNVWGEVKHYFSNEMLGFGRSCFNDAFQYGRLSTLPGRKEGDNE